MVVFSIKTIKKCVFYNITSVLKKTLLILMILIDDDDVNANNTYAFIFTKCVPKQCWEGMVGKKRIFIDLQHHTWLSCLKPKPEG